MTTETIPPFWMHEQVTAEDYDSWPEERCRDIEIMDGMVVMTPSPSKPHNRLAKMLSLALEAGAGNQWRADLDFDVRLRDIPLLNRRPDVVVYRSDMFRVSPTRPEHVLLIAEIVSPGSETTDRIVKPNEYAAAGIEYYWRVERADTRLPVVHTHVLDDATGTYQATGVFTGVVKAIAPFPVEIDLRDI